MTPLQTALAAAVAFFGGWGLHGFFSSVPEPPALMSLGRPAPEPEPVTRETNKGSDIITPLNVRDPSALVMGPGSTAAKNCQPTKPCDCEKEFLEKQSRAKPETF